VRARRSGTASTTKRLLSARTQLMADHDRRIGEVEDEWFGVLGAWVFQTRQFTALFN
jgi:hypothetical protein